MTTNNLKNQPVTDNDQDLLYLAISSVKHKQDIKQAIISYDLEFVENYLKNQSVTNNDQDLLYLALSCKNFYAFELLSQKIQIQNIDFMIAKAMGTYLLLCLYIVEHSQCQKFNNSTLFIDSTDNHHYFHKESILKRQFNSPVFQNNKQKYIHQILYNSLKFQNINDDDFLVTNYLIENRVKLSIKDQTIIQYIVEKNYKFYSNFNSNTAINFFEQTIKKLISEGVDLSLDTNSYLVQLAAFNNLLELAIDLHKNGCLIDNFLHRYNNKNNWLSKVAETALINEIDCKNYRKYDIYKKFDTTHQLVDQDVKKLSIYLSYYNMNQKFPYRNTVNKQLKI